MIKLTEIFNESVPEVLGPLVYRIFNSIDGKCYIGQTKRSLYSRFITDSRSSHLCRLNSNHQGKLYVAIRNLGIENFYVEYWITNINELDEVERRLINEYDSVNAGYNDTIGGHAFSHSAQVNGAYNLSLKCKESELGAFFNSEVHSRVCSLGGESLSFSYATKVIKLLEEKGLELNERNYNMNKKFIAHNAPRFSTVKLRYPDLIK